MNLRDLATTALARTASAPAHPSLPADGTTDHVDRFVSMMPKDMTPAQTGIAVGGALLALGDQVVKLRATVDRLERELTEARVMKFCGPHDPARSYAPGSVVLRSNAAHVALVQTSGAPGSSDQWRRIGG